jgi:hypothetical protein
MSASHNAITFGCEKTTQVITAVSMKMTALWDQGIIALVMETKMAVKRWLSFNELTRS